GGHALPEAVLRPVPGRGPVLHRPPRLAQRQRDEPGDPGRRPRARARRAERARARRRFPRRDGRRGVLPRGGPLRDPALRSQLLHVLRRRGAHRRADPGLGQRGLQGPSAVRRRLLPPRRRRAAGHGRGGAQDRGGLLRGRDHPRRRGHPELVDGPRRAVRRDQPRAHAHGRRGEPHPFPVRGERGALRARADRLLPHERRAPRGRQRLAALRRDRPGRRRLRPARAAPGRSLSFRPASLDPWRAPSTSPVRTSPPPTIRSPPSGGFSSSASWSILRPTSSTPWTAPPHWRSPSSSSENCWWGGLSWRMTPWWSRSPTGTTGPRRGRSPPQCATPPRSTATWRPAPPHNSTTARRPPGTSQNRPPSEASRSRLARGAARRCFRFFRPGRRPLPGTRRPPMITDGLLMLGVLLGLSCVLIVLERTTGWKLCRFVPGMVLMYLVCAALNSVGVFGQDDATREPVAQVKDVLLPAMILLFLFGCDIRKIIRLGPKLLLTYAVSAASLFIGIVVVVTIFQCALHPEAWKVFVALLASCTGGSSNM